MKNLKVHLLNLDLVLLPYREKYIKRMINISTVYLCFYVFLIINPLNLKFTMLNMHYCLFFQFIHFVCVITISLKQPSTLLLFYFYIICSHRFSILGSLQLLNGLLQSKHCFDLLNLSYNKLFSAARAVFQSNN